MVFRCLGPMEQGQPRMYVCATEDRRRAPCKSRLFRFFLVPSCSISFLGIGQDPPECRVSCLSGQPISRKAEILWLALGKGKVLVLMTAWKKTHCGFGGSPWERTRDGRGKRAGGGQGETLLQSPSLWGVSF